MSEELVKASATWMAQAIRRREVSAVELLDAHAARIAERDPRVNALVFPRLPEARAEAVAADAALARGDHLGPLHGVPFTAKEVDRRSRGCPRPTARGCSPTTSREGGRRAAAPPARCRRHPLGKTNVPEFCSYWDTYNELFGATATRTTPRAAPVAPRAARGPRWRAR